jgi:DNA processing protein
MAPRDAERLVAERQVAEQIAALRLARSAELGPITFRNLLDRFGSAEAALEALPALASRGGRAVQIRVAAEETARAEIENAAAIGARLIVFGEPEYPAPLAAAPGAPPILFVRGRVDLLARSMIAIVGARNASANGRKLAESLAAGIGARGHVIVSGLARGIDAAAHKGSLATGTVAVLAGGIDQIYPEDNRALAEAIAETGALVTEMPFGHVARAVDFPRRNRIIAGLARGTLVVEAAERSGSLITARLALELGREVFAVPGSPLDARCKGTNGLLRDGAVLTESAEDIEAHLPPIDAPSRRPPPRVQSFQLNLSDAADAPRRPPPSAHHGDSAAADRPLATRVLELLGPSPTAIDELVRQTGASAAQVQAALLDLELDGLTLRHPGQMVARAPAP